MPEAMQIMGHRHPSHCPQSAHQPNPYSCFDQRTVGLLDRVRSEWVRLYQLHRLCLIDAVTARTGCSGNEAAPMTTAVYETSAVTGWATTGFGPRFLIGKNGRPGLVDCGACWCEPATQAYIAVRLRLNLA